MGSSENRGLEIDNDKINSEANHATVLQILGELQ